MKRRLFCFINLVLAVLLTAALSCAAEGGVTPTVKQPTAAVPVKTPAVELLDINSATAEQLKKIPGIGAETAKKIIAGRPYVKKDQLKSRKIISSELYFKIKDHIIARQIREPVKK